ncbi:MAG: efflux RND transporter periplasmic adaptor subunit [Deltaproteobacteria bacterium]|nr:efflux RND transporter periplasmic adaptor subunit [Deltaproteobacteria bacterium]
MTNLKLHNLNDSDENAALNNILSGESKSFFAGRRFLIFAIIAAIIVAVILLYFLSNDSPIALQYKTKPVSIGKLVVRVSTTGNLQPINMVEVSSELSGIVTEVLVDENDVVKKGQVLANLDLSKLKDTVEKSQASLVVAQAQVKLAQATVTEASTTVDRYNKVFELSGGKVPSKSEMDAAIASLKRAEANEASAHASVAQAKANLQSDLTNLSKASIRSPIDGLVLSRSIEPGQTVAATLQAPVLFTLAEDLTKMELKVDVDEADVGQIKVGQQASFTVDAWPGRKYFGVITRVGFGSQIVDGVVSYPTVIAVQNDDLSLRPGMTGTADIITVTRDKALLVSNAALRFTPPVIDKTPQKPQNFMGKLMPRRPHPQRNVIIQPNPNAPRVWILQHSKPVPIDIKTGASDGHVTEITGGDIKEGTEVLTEVIRPKS